MSRSPARRDARFDRLLPISRWPSADEAASARWFSPLTLGPVRARDRTWVPAMVPWRATESGEVTPAVLEWYARFAEGRPGVLVVEATGIRDVPSGPLLRIGHDRFLPGLSRLVETVREASGGQTRLFIQIIDFLRIRRRPDPGRFFARFLEIGDHHRAALVSLSGEPALASASEATIRERLAALDDAALCRVLTDRELESLRMGARERVTDLHLPHVRDLPKTLPGLFAAAAGRAETAGFDGVELHFAHAYTMASFLSRKNDRTDGYGGSIENRLRLPLEVHGAVRAAVSDAFAVGCRFLGDEAIEGGSDLEDAIRFGVAFAEAGLDFLSISKGGKFEDARPPRIGQAAYPYTGESGHECMPTTKIGPPGPFGRNVPLSAAIRRAVRDAGHETPIVTAGGICSFEQAEAILARGEADAVAAARQTLCDPDWFEKIRRGRGEAVRRCLYTNYCEGLDQAHKAVTCQRWDRLRLPDEDPDSVPMTEDGRRRRVAPRWGPEG